jgi:hypothetical protein
MRLEANSKPSIHNLIHEFLINMAFTMACLNFKKGLKMAFGPLGVNGVALQQMDCLLDRSWLLPGPGGSYPMVSTTMETF